MVDAERDEAKGRVLHFSEVTIAGEQPEPKVDAFSVAPTRGDEFNRLRSLLVPRACFRVEDAIFAFDSSFIPFGRSPDVDKLKEVLDKSPGSKLSIFGHADPVGRDDFNKVLSGRRARAVYGMLLQDPAEWRPLYLEHDSNGKDQWGLRAIQIMLNVVGSSQGEPAGSGVRTDGVMDEPTREKLRTFQPRNGLAQTPFGPPPEHLVDPATFDALAAKYMEILCLVDAKGTSFKAQKSDFLTQGERKDGKGDYQGCSEFNPVLVFSDVEQKDFDRKDQREARNAENQPNRRVMILIFKPGSRVDPKRWPCPSATEGPAGCRKRFFKAVKGAAFADGNERRAPSSQRREFEKTKDTFACRFYQTLVESSPCEQIVRSVSIRFYDLDGVRIPDAAFRVLTLSGAPTGQQRFADTDGIAVVKSTLPSVRVAWGPPRRVAGKLAFPDALPFSLDLRLEVDDQDADDLARASLHNLGYVLEETEEENVKAFERDERLPETGSIAGKTGDRLRAVLRDRPDRLPRADAQAGRA